MSYMISSFITSFVVVFALLRSIGWPKRLFYNVYADGVILHWLRIFFRRFFSQQFKRSCLPDGPKVGSVSLSPRGDWRMPSDAMSTDWLNELEGLS